MNSITTIVLQSSAAFLISALLPSCGGSSRAVATSVPATKVEAAPKAVKKANSKDFAPGGALPTPIENPWLERDEARPDSPTE